MSEMEDLDRFLSDLKTTSSFIRKRQILSQATDFQRFVLYYLYSDIDTGLKASQVLKIKPQRTGSGASLTPLLNYIIRSKKPYKDLNVVMDYISEVAGESGYPVLVLQIVSRSIVLGVGKALLLQVFGQGVFNGKSNR